MCGVKWGCICCVLCLFSVGVVYMGCVGGIPIVCVWHMSVLYVCCLVCHIYSVSYEFCVCDVHRS